MTQSAEQLLHSAVVLAAGIGVRIESNAERAVELMRVRYPLATIQGDAPCTICVIVGQVHDAASPAVAWRLADNTHAVVTGAGLHADVSTAEGRAVVRVDREFLESPQFGRTVGGGILYTLLTRRDRHPVHAAAIRRGNAVLLLHGKSGVGKSTLAYAAYRAGFGVLADDAVRVQLRPTLRVWGDGTPPTLRLLRNVVEVDVSLRARLRDVAADEDGKLSVATGHEASEWVPFAERARVCLLTRGGGGAGDVELRAASTREIHDALLSAPDVDLDLAPEQRAPVAAALAHPGGWHLTLSRRGDDAVPSLHRMFDAIGSA